MIDYSLGSNHSENTDTSITNVFIPREHAGPASELPARNPATNNRKYGEGDAELDIELAAIRQRRSHALTDAVQRFAEDPNQTVLVNLGKGPGKSEPRAPTDEELDELIAAGSMTQAIATVIEPVDLDLYRSFIPAPLEMPEKPMVGCSLLDMNREASKLSRYQEGRVRIKVRQPDGLDGWILLSAPVTGLYYCREGVLWGWPKYLVDECSFSPERTECRYEGSVRYSLDFTPGPVEDEAALKASGFECLGGGSTLTWHILPGGATLLRSEGGGNAVPPRELDWQAGMVEVYIRPEDPFSKLIPEGSKTPGIYAKRAGGGGGDGIRRKVCTVLGGEITVHV